MHRLISLWAFFVSGRLNLSRLTLKAPEIRASSGLRCYSPCHCRSNKCSNRRRRSPHRLASPEPLQNPGRFTLAMIGFGLGSTGALAPVQLQVGRSAQDGLPVTTWAGLPPSPSPASGNLEARPAAALDGAGPRSMPTSPGLRAVLPFPLELPRRSAGRSRALRITPEGWADLRLLAQIRALPP